MNMAASSEEYMNGFYNEWNIPEFCEKSSWLGAIFGDSGDEYENMAGRVIQFTRDRVEKELDNLSLGYRGSGTLQYDYRHVYCQF